jgi:Mg-chelatase subunit ChlD
MMPSFLRIPRVALFASLIGSGVILAGPAGCGSDDLTSAFPDAGGGSSGSSGSSGMSSGSSGDFGIRDGASQSDAPLDFDAACATSKVQAKRAPANILFIVDRSGSMNCNPPPTTASSVCEQFPVTADTTKPSKWQITRDALKGAIAAMPLSNSVGFTLFNNNDACGVQSAPNVAVAPATPTQIALLSTQLDAVTPKGLTPIVGGVTLGYNYMNGSIPVASGKKFLVLITDGEETCAKDQTEGFVETTVKNATLVGIKTFVIGAPGSEQNRALLSRIAFNGQTPKTATCAHAATPANVGDCHFDLSASGTNLATELNAALDSISKQALGCEYDVPAPASGTLDYSKVNVLYTPSGGMARSVPQDNTKACDGGADGWQYSADKSKIILCGATCSAVKADASGDVSIALGCGTIIR